MRQLRLRDIGGIIVIDFIDMVLPGNRELLLRGLWSVWDGTGHGIRSPRSPAWAWSR